MGPSDDSRKSGEQSADQATGTESSQTRDKSNASDSSRGSRAAGSGASRNTHRDILLHCIQHPAQGFERLPYILNLLENDDRDIRLLAAMTACQIAIKTDDEDVIEYLVRRMSDRLTDDQLSLELTTALDYLSSKYSEQVESLLEELTDPTDDDIPVPEVGSFTRNYYYGREFDREGIGRRRIAGEDSEENPYETVADRKREELEKAERERERAGTTTRLRDSREPVPQQTEDEDDDVPEETADPSTIARRSRFDQIHVEGRHYASRYAIVYETLVGRRGDEQAIALRLLSRPSMTGELRSLEEQLSEQLSFWASIGDHENIVQVWDWGIQPQPWLATSYVDGTLVSYPQPSVASGLRMAVSLAEAVTHMHQHNVVHGGIDPRNVVFPGDPFEDNLADIPMLDNIGLPTVYMDEDSAGDYVDSRFQAPEQYSDDYGRTDHSTDIYQLGATVFYLLTGHPPFRGDESEIRAAVLEGTVPAASAVVDGLPETVDEIITKAMATQKMRRYETVEQLLRDLQRVAEPDTRE